MSKVQKTVKKKAAKKVRKNVGVTIPGWQVVSPNHPNGPSVERFIRDCPFTPQAAILGTYTTDLPFAHTLHQLLGQVPTLVVYGHRNRAAKHYQKGKLTFVCGSGFNGVHHAKYVCLFGGNTWQMCITTANLTGTSRSLNFLWTSPVFEDRPAPKTTDNGRQLGAFFTKLHECCLTNQEPLTPVTFCEQFAPHTLDYYVKHFRVPRGHLVASIPDSPHLPTGHARIRHLLRKHRPACSTSDQLFVQPTSIGTNLNGQFMTDCLETFRHSPAPQKTTLILPPLVINSKLIQQRMVAMDRHWFDRMRTMQLHDPDCRQKSAAGHTNQIVPHTKLYLRTTATRQPVYAFFGSQSLSRGAMGYRVCPHQKRSKNVKQTCQCPGKCRPIFLCRNFELGLLFLVPKSLEIPYVLPS